MRDKVNYFNLFKNVMDEKGVSISDLERNKVLTHNTFYKFDKFCPTLQNCLAIANFLKVSLDYVFEKSDVNSFKKPYKVPQNFGENIIKVLASMKMNQKSFCDETGISSGTISKWRKGVQPKMSTILDICEILLCNIDDLLETEK